jgi:hypothetical protein
MLRLYTTLLWAYVKVRGNMVLPLLLESEFFRILAFSELRIRILK